MPECAVNCYFISVGEEGEISFNTSGGWEMTAERWGRNTTFYVVFKGLFGGIQEQEGISWYPGVG
jgi:hypothetical protein